MRLIGVIVLALIAATFGNAGEVEKEHLSDAGHSTTQVHPDPPTTPHPKPTPTKKPSPPTTTHKTPTTTEKPKPPTTTAKPSPTTTQKPTPPPPAPKPSKPTQGHWSLNFTKSTQQCIVVQAAIQLVLNYTTIDNKTATGYLDVPANATATGTCSPSSNESLTLTWPLHNATLKASVVLSFAKDKDDYDLSGVQVSVDPDAYFFPNISANATTMQFFHNQSEFTTDVSKSYSCAKEQDLQLVYNVTATNATFGTLKVSEFQFQAFANTTNNTFSSAQECGHSSPKTSEVVPIVVGATLAILVGVVLVAYLIGRRRSQARGYLSMFTETKQESDYIPMRNFSCFP